MPARTPDTAPATPRGVAPHAVVSPPSSSPYAVRGTVGTDGPELHSQVVVEKLQPVDGHTRA